MRKGVEEIKEYPNELNINRDMSELESKHYLGKIEEVELYKIVSAPEEWNRFNPLSEDKKNEVKSSIKRLGLHHPVILWDNGKGKNEGMLTCLSGHNRVEIYKELMEEDPDKYYKIPAIIKGRDEIDANTAQQIIIDLNIAQRDMSKIELSKAIIKKFKLLKESKNKSSASEKTFTEILETEFGITGRQIRKYKKLVSLIEEFQKIIEEGLITIDTGCFIARLNENLQKDLFDIVSNNESYLKMLNKKAKNIKEHEMLTREHLEELFQEETPKEGKIKIELLDESNNKVSAKLTYPKEQEKYFLSLLEVLKNTNEKIEYDIIGKNK